MLDSQVKKRELTAILARLLSMSMDKVVKLLMQYIPIRMNLIWELVIKD